jgi:hypothetical protein
MNPFEMVVGIVLIVTIGTIIRAKLGVGRDHRGGGHSLPGGRSDDALLAEIRALRDEVKSLKKRQAVIERITVEKESSLEREIDRLRDE